jgi:hypothetical protein
MDTILTWSGSASHEIASFFRDWLKTVVPGVEPWISDEDIAKGKKWFPELMKQLTKTGVSITFITPENVRSPWVYYEVGVIAAKNEACIVCPYLIGVAATHVRDTPLGQFQWTLANKEDTARLIRSINEVLGEKAHDPGLLQGNFNSQWPSLKRQLDQVSKDLSPVDEDVVEVEPSIEQLLSEEARELLVAAAQDPHGIILNLRDSAGFQLVCSQKGLVEDQSPRNVVRWKAALQELRAFGLVEAQGY